MMNGFWNHTQCIHSKSTAFTVLMLCALHFVQAQTPALEWAAQTSSPSLKFLNAMAVDNEGNTLVAISSGAAFTFAGVQIPHFTLLTGSASGANLIKLDPSGNVLWHRSLRGPWQSGAFCGGIDTDEDNNIFVTYTGSSNVENASPIGGLYAVSPRTRDEFLVKISPDGDGLWYKVANYAPGMVSSARPKLKVSPDGSVYTCGFLGTSVNFDGTVLVNENTASTYLTKHDLDGNLIWAKSIQSVNGYVGVPTGLDVGSDGSVYMASEWEGESLQIDEFSIENELAFTGNADRWICKLSPEGTAEWLVREHSAASQWVTNIAVTPEDGLLVLSHKGAGDLFIGDTSVSSEGVVLSHYSATGEVISASLLGGSLGNEFASPPSIVSDGNQSYYLCGGFSSPTYSIGGLQVSNQGGSTGTGDAYVLKMNAAGEAEWIYTMGGEESESAQFIGSVNSDRLVTGGAFGGFGFTLQGISLVPHTEFNSENFLASFSTALNTRTAEALQHLLAYPNPFSENVQFDAEALQAFGNATLVVFNTNGTEVYRKQLQGNEAAQMNLSHLPKGAYVARLSDGIQSLHTKIVKL